MNKQKFVELLRSPDTISDDNLAELEQLVVQNPYFHSAHTIVAKAAKDLKSKQAAKRINTAAIYATSRKALKNYIQGSITFEDRPAISRQEAETAKKSQTQEVPQQPSVPEVVEAPKEKEVAKKPVPKTEHDSLVDEVYENIKEWEKSRNMFLEYELATEDESTDVAKSDVDEIKSQIAREIIEEEEEVEQAMQEIADKGAPEEEAKEEDKTSEEAPAEEDPLSEILDEDVESIEEDENKKDSDGDSDDQLLEISKQKESLKLSPGNKGGKKFRLNILNRPSPKSKTTAKKKSTTTKAAASTAKKSTTKASAAKTTASKKTTKTATKSTAKKATAAKATTTSTTKKAATKSTTKKASTATAKKATTTKKPAAKKATSTTKKTAASTTKKTRATAKGSTKTKSTTAGRKKKTDTEEGEKKKPKEAQLKKNTDQGDLIDQFIQNQPSISTKAVKADSEENVDLSEKSTKFPSQIVTENLARIFESQGKNDQAISIYEQLILINPQKKSYFASRIENLKK